MSFTNFSTDTHEVFLSLVALAAFRPHDMKEETNRNRRGIYHRLHPDLL